MEDYELEHYNEVIQIQNRPDKSILTINSIYPEKFLTSDIDPKQVLSLTLDLSFDTTNCSKKMEEWEYKYDRKLCKGLLNFTNLEILNLVDVNLSSDLWTQFAQNATRLKHISFKSWLDIDRFWFDGDGEETKEEGLEAVLKIPTLENVTFSWLHLPFFPKGPSNIKRIKLDRIKSFDDDTEQYESYFSNFCTHTNLISVIVEPRGDYPFQFSTLRLEELKQLENLDFDGCLDTEEDFESLKAILDLPKLTNLTVGFMVDSKVENFIYNKETDYEKLDFLKEQVDLLKYEFILKNL